MNLLIVGATGRIGRLVCQQGLEQGHRVTAFGRNPRTWKDAPNALRWERGSALDAADVSRAMQGQDAVIVALGDGRKGEIREAGTRVVLDAMKKTGTRRMVVLSSLGAGESVNNLNFFWRHIMFGILLRKALDDHNRQEALVRASGLDWTILRPGAYAKGPVTGTYRRGFSTDDQTIALKQSAADVAHALLAFAVEPETIGQAIGISN
jgi:uncharacterized protein YbjT (DUF2867 family)